MPRGAQHDVLVAFLVSMRILLLGLLAGSSLSFSVAAQVPSYPVPAFMLAQRYQLPAADCALFPAAAAANPAIGSLGRFTPVAQQVDSAEHALALVTLAHTDSPSSAPEPANYAAYHATMKQGLAHYRRQYFGFYNGANHPSLHITFLREADAGAFWLQHYVIVYDAGPDYWTICYDLTAKVFYNFEHGGQ